MDDVFEAQAVKRPDHIPAELVEYVDYLEALIEHMERRVKWFEDELNRKPGAEARGIAWCDMYGVINGKTTKINITSRSDVDAVHALQGLRIARKEAMNLGLKPTLP